MNASNHPISSPYSLDIMHEGLSDVWTWWRAGNLHLQQGRNTWSQKLAACEKYSLPIYSYVYFPKVTSMVYTRRDSYSRMYLLYHVSQPLGHGLLPVWGLLGTGLHSRGCVEGEHVSLCLYLQSLHIAHFTVWALPRLRSGVALVLRRAWTLLWTTGT